MFSENKTPPGRSNLQIRFLQDAEGYDTIHIYWRDSKDEQTRRVKSSDLERWPSEWAVYEQAKEKIAKIDGTPLLEVPMITRDIANKLRFQHAIVTVERLAQLDDFAASQIDIEQGINWRNLAQMYLAAYGVNKPKEVKKAA